MKDFDADLSEATGLATMFGNDSNNCAKLNLKSIKNILRTIKTNDREQGIYLGIDSSLQGDSELEETLQQIREKGWVVYEIYSNN